MSDTLRTRIAAIIDTHTAVGAEGQVTCWCDSQQFDGFHAHAMHAADAVIRELQLQRESPQLCVGGGDRHRWVTEWVSGG